MNFDSPRFSEFFLLAIALALLAASSALANIPETKSQEIAPVLRCERLTTFQAIETSDMNCLAKAITRMDPEEWDESGNRALHRAAALGKLEAVKFLLARGADLRARNGYGAETPRVAAERAGQRDVADLLAAVETETDQLVRAIEAKNFAHAHGSVQRGAALGMRDARYDTPLHIAAAAGAERIGEVLLQHGADKDAKNYLGNTPLHEAIASDNEAFVSLLLKFGAAFEIQNERRETARDFAENSGNAELVSRLRKISAKPGKRRDLELGLSISEGEGNYPVNPSGGPRP